MTFLPPSNLQCRIDPVLGLLVSWDDNSDEEDRRELQYKEVAWPDYLVAMRPLADVVEVQVGFVLPGKTYDFRIRDQRGPFSMPEYTDFSNVARIRIPAVGGGGGPVPLYPDDFAVEPVSTTRVRSRWTPVVGADIYIIKLDYYVLGNLIQRYDRVDDGAASEFLHTGLDETIEYQISIATFVGSERSDFGPPQFIVPVSTVTAVAAYSSAVSTEPTSAVVFFDKSGIAEVWRIQAKLHSAGTWAGAMDKVVDDPIQEFLAIQFAGLSGGLQYDTRARGEVEPDAGDWSDVGTFTTLGGVGTKPLAPTNFAGSASGPNAIATTWVQAAGADGYRITVTDGLTSFEITAVPGTVEAQPVEDLVSGTTYFLTIRSFNDAGESDDFLTIEVRTDDDPVVPEAAQTVREQVLRNVVTTLEGISGLDGFNTKVLRVSRKNTGRAPEPRPAIQIEEPEEQGPSLNHGSRIGDPVTEINMTLLIHYWLDAGGKDSETLISQALGDIQRAMNDDPGRGEWAECTYFDGSTAFDVSDPVGVVCVFTRWTIKYRFQSKDPTVVVH